MATTEQGDRRVEASDVDLLPDMMFAHGEEPVGVRVLTYQSSRAIKRILSALEERELQIIQESSFGKMVEIAEKPSFSGRFARYIMSRQLKVNKRHEAWFRFAGHPVRFSLREFAIVTGLPCGEFPLKSKAKMKETISSKPYWPELFGKVDTVGVSSVIKMLKKKTVKDQEIRVKYACLAILSSVLLSTNLKMKISREHAEAIEDLQDFFMYPWGRMAFDMLMGSIKERDEVSLSQNTIALKGFALALQLVMVEAVPALTECFQDTFSSSESDSDDDLEEISDKGGRKRTLNPGHARAIDKKGQVVVRCILEEDPTRPLDECTFVWKDELEDPKVDNLLRLIKEKYLFNASMFKGGATSIEVERLREQAKPKNKQRKKKQPPLATSNVEESGNTTMLLEKLKPEFERIYDRLANCDAVGRGLDMRVTSLETSVPGVFDSLLQKVKDHVMGNLEEMVKGMVSKAETAVPNVSGGSRNIAQKQQQPGAENGELYNETIRNVLGNLMQYSTPTKSQGNNQGASVTPGDGEADGESSGNREDMPHIMTTSAQSQTERTDGDNPANPLDLEQPYTGPDAEDPSFSLGMTQEGDIQASTEKPRSDPPSNLDDAKVDDNINGEQACRKSKRQKTAPNSLLTDYECSARFVSRVRQSRKFLFATQDPGETLTNYKSLIEKLKTPIVVDVDGLTVNAKEISDIAERGKPPTAKIVDILMRLLRAIVDKNPSHADEAKFVIFDTRFITSLTRSYVGFSKANNRDTYVFPKGLVEYFSEKMIGSEDATRYYLPMQFEKKEWVGVCVDCAEWQVYVFDCITSASAEVPIDKRVRPLCEMFPYLLKECGRSAGVVMPMEWGRAKGICVGINQSDSGMMSVLQMGIHALYGIEACRSIVPDVLPEEAKAAAIMAYEFHEKL